MNSDPNEVDSRNHVLILTSVASAPPIARSTGVGTGSSSSSSPVAPSRQGKKAMTGYFSPDMSFAMHMTARRHSMSLQDAMAEAFNDWLRKMGESPVGK